MSANYRLPFIIAAVLHLGVLGFLLVNMTAKPQAAPVEEPNDQPIVQAQTVNQQQVEQEISRIETERARKQAQEQQRVKRLQQQAEAAKKKQQQEKARLAKIKQQQKKLEEENKRQQALIAKQRREAAAQRKKAEQAKLAAEKAKQEQLKQQQAALAAQKKAEQARKEAQARERERELAAARAKRVQSELPRYIAEITQAIRQQWIIPDVDNAEIEATLLIKVAPGGVVLSVDVIKSSGSEVYDRSAKTAVLKASPLPVPADPDLFDLVRTLRLTVRPDGHEVL